MCSGLIATMCRRVGARGCEPAAIGPALADRRHMSTRATAEELQLEGCSALTGEPAKLIFITQALRARRRHSEARTAERLRITDGNGTPRHR